MARFDAADVRRYYDRHTPAFVSRGQGASVGAIHRAVWGPGVRTRTEAFHYVDDRIAEYVRGMAMPAGATPHVVDLGCGVGASLTCLAEALPIRGTGVTLSPVQASIATERIRARGLSEHVRCIEADFTALPGSVPPADLAYAIESFVHGPDPAAFFAECGRLIRPGGMLVICDDFRREARGAAAADAIEQFCEGWHINTLLHARELRALAGAHGFEHVSTLDLSPYLEIHRTRDLVIAGLLALVGWLPAARPKLAPLLGGRALQTCLSKGWIGYDLAAFRRI